MRSLWRRPLALLTIAILALTPALSPVGPFVDSASATSAPGGSCAQTVSNATNVTVTRLGNDCIISFRRVGTTSWTVPSGVTGATVLVVAGGGGGGSDNGGGGGGGGVRYETLSVSATPSISVVVGEGGAASGVANNNLQTNGGNSSFGNLSALGGGQGGNGESGARAATSGGSGGGGHGERGATTTSAGAAGTVGQGHKGGDGYRSTQITSAGDGGGGGGAGEPGKDGGTEKPGDGGNGRLIAITGGSFYYGSGGGGGRHRTSTSDQRSGSGGSSEGGGAGGGMGNTTAGNGEDGFGGGGGGSAITSLSGGRGGSGVVIVRYTLRTQSTLGFVSPTPSSLVRGATGSLSVTGGSGSGALSYSVSGPCSLSGTTVTASSTSSGSCVVTATKAEDSAFLARSVNLTIPVRGTQTISFPDPPADRDYSPDAFPVSAESNRSETVSYGSQTPDTCSVSTPEGSVTMLRDGTCTLRAFRIDDGTWFAAEAIHSFVVSKASQSITFDALSARPFSPNTFSLSATATSGLTVGFTSTTTGICTVSGTAVTMLKSGDCTIRASQGGNTTQYNAAAPVDRSFSISKANQSITFDDPGSQTFGVSPFGLTVSTDAAGLTSTVTASPAGVCTVSGTEVTVVGAGDCTLVATQGGDDRYNSATAVTRTFTVAKADQAGVSLSSSASVPFGQSSTLVASGGSGTGAYSFTKLSGECTLTGATLVPTDVGSCVVKVTRAADANYNEQTSDITITITKGNQSISFTNPGSKTFGVSPFGLTVSTDAAGLTAEVTSSAEAVCTVSGTTVTILKSGTCTLVANQEGDSRYNAATAVTQSFTVTKASQTITFANPGAKTFGVAAFSVSPSTDASGLTLTVSSSTTDVCTVSSGTVTIVAAGQCTLVATQSGDDRYLEATRSVSFTVSTATQTITFAKPINRPLLSNTFVVEATASSNLSVTFVSLTEEVCTVSGATVTMVKSGTCTIRASQGGNDTQFSAAANVERSFEITNTVTFRANFVDGPDDESQQVVTGQETALRGNTFSRTGYTFAGWATNADGSGANYSNAGLVTLSEGLTLYAKWTANTNTVTFRSNYTGGPANETQPIVTDVSTALASNGFSRSGYGFAGWNTQANGGGTSYTDGESVSLKGALTLFAQWTPDQYTIRFAKGSTAGAAGDSQTAVKTHDAVLVLPDFATASGYFTRAGYTLTGWSLEEDGFSKDFNLGANFTTEAATTLYPVWTPNTYTVTYEYNGATGGDTVSSSSYTVDSIVVSLPSPTRAGYLFGGWFSNSGLTASVGAAAASYEPTADVTLYAKWTPATFTVLYDYNEATGGDGTESATYTTEGTTITLPTPTRAGYTFAGWFADAEHSESVGAAGASYSPTSNLTVYAKWTAITRTVTYNSTNADSGVAPVDSGSYIIGDTIVVKANSGSLARTGYTFMGWVTNSDGTGTALNVGQTPTVATSDIALYPQWSPNTYTISYNLNGGSGDLSAAPTSWTTGTSNVTLPSSGITKTGYTFDGWQELGDTTKLNTSYQPDFENVTLVARWIIKSIDYSFSKGTAGTTDITGWPVDASANFGETITLPSLTGTTVTIADKSYEFFGWESARATYKSGDPYVLGEDPPTFVAQWVELFDVRYGFGGGTHSLPGDGASECVSNGLCVDGQTITLRTAPERPGYTFTGWKVHDTATIKQAGAEHTVVATEYLFYAQWSAINHRFTFNSLGGNVNTSSQDKNIGQLVTLPSPGTKTGYSFAGWSADGGDTLYIAGATHLVGTEGLAFSAQWIPDVYTVSYDWQGGISASAKASDSFTVGTGNMTLPTDTGSGYARDGFTFQGWSTTVGGALLSDYQPTADVLLFAVWADGNYTLSYDAKGGEVGTGLGTVARGDTVTLPTPVRANFTFLGWFDSATGGNKIGDGGASFTPTASITLHARWIQDSLFGLDMATLETGSTYTASSSSSVDITISHIPSGTSARIQIPAGSLPDGTVVTVRYFKETSRQSGLIPGDNTYFFALLVAWINGSGDSATVPTTAEGKPITVTLTNPNIKAGAMVYQVIGQSVTELGRATQDGEVTVELTEDPEIVVASTTPDAPTNVEATPGDTRAHVSWVLEDENTGGETITEYTVTASPGGATCRTAEKSCFVESLSNGVAYTFTVTATNRVGSSGSSAASSAVTPVGGVYTVTFDSRGGGSVSGSNFLSGGGLDAPGEPSRPGYTFAGWSATDQGNTAVGFPYSPGVTRDITLFALWTVNTYTVTYDSREGSAVNPGSFETDGSVAEEPSDPTRTGYGFAGWSLTDGGSAVDFGGSGFSPGVAENITLFALWTPQSQDITYNNNGGSGTITATSGNTESSVSLAGTGMSRTGYTLQRWNTQADGEGTSHGLGHSLVMPPGGLALFAVWEPDTHVVTFDSAGGSAVANGSFVTDGEISSLPAAPSRTGYTFAGWSATEQGNTAVGFPYSPGATRDITLFALWSAITYTVTYDSREGSAVNPGSFETDGSVAEKPSDPTRTGYTFAGWSATPVGSAVGFGGSGYSPGVTQNITLFAQWTPDTYTITFSKGSVAGASGGTQSLTKTHDLVLTLPDSALANTYFLYTGRQVAGWSLSPDGSTLDYSVGANFTIESATTLYPVWALASYPVTFNSGGGSPVAPGTFLFGGEVVAPIAPVRAGFTFDGWGTVANDASSMVVFPYDPGGTTGVTLFGMWTALPVAPSAPGRPGAPAGANEAPILAPNRVIPPRTPVSPPAMLPGPVLNSGMPLNPLGGVSATIGGVPSTVTTTPSANGANLQTGSLFLWLSVANPGAAANGGSGPGVVMRPGAAPEIQIPSGGNTALSGGGALPGSTLQIWLPGNGENAREIARLPVKADGSFHATMAFTNTQGDAPMPIGRQILQVSGYDEDGNQTVLNMTINVAQGAPVPERNRVLNEVPTLQPGQILGTSGGITEIVSVAVLPEESQVEISSGDWGFAISVNEQFGSVENQQGAALVTMEQQSSIFVSGAGFQPETRMDIWLFSEPVLLGSVTVSIDGTLDTEVWIDALFIEPGQHTLQLQAVGDDGMIKAANLGVLVVEAVTLTQESAAGLLWWMVALGLVVGIVVVVYVGRTRRSRELTS
jgi:uncharacterized repeat protein (TIGR02543 family)